MKKISNKDKCGYCRKRIPRCNQTILCSSCSLFFHAKCSYTSSSRRLAQSISWRCNACLQGELAFQKMDDQALQSTLYGLDNFSSTLNFSALTSFTVKSLIDKIPMRALNFEQLTNHCNTSKYHSIAQFQKRNFSEKSTFAFLHINISSLEKPLDELQLFLETLQYSFMIMKCLIEIEEQCGSFTSSNTGTNRKNEI